jgi:hypothetical protein
MELGKELVSIFRHRQGRQQNELALEAGATSLLQLMARDPSKLRVVAARAPGITLVRFHVHGRIPLGYKPHGIQPKDLFSHHHRGPSVGVMHVLASPLFRGRLQEHMERTMGPGASEHLRVLLKPWYQSKHVFFLRMEWGPPCPLAQDDVLLFGNPSAVVIAAASSSPSAPRAPPGSGEP